MARVCFPWTKQGLLVAAVVAELWCGLGAPKGMYFPCEVCLLLDAHTHTQDTNKDPKMLSNSYKILTLLCIPLPLGRRRTWNTSQTPYKKTSKYTRGQFILSLISYERMTCLIPFSTYAYFFFFLVIFFWRNPLTSATWEREMKFTISHSNMNFAKFHGNRQLNEGVLLRLSGDFWVNSAVIRASTQECIPQNENPR